MKSLNLLKRLEMLENVKESKQQKVFVFSVYEDFKGPTAMQKEFSKDKYRGCTLILNDIP